MPSAQFQNSEDADARMKELILYITDYCQENDSLGYLGATNLNKILLYSDFAAYLKLGKAITNQEYFALEWGPAPKRMVPIKEQMETSRDIRTAQAALGSKHTQQIIIPLRKPDLSHFTADEISIVDQAILRFIFKGAKWSSDESHKFIGWEAAQLREVIPYSSAYLDAPHILGQEPTKMVSKSAMEHARRLEPEANRLLEKYA